MKDECLICGAPLKYLENDELMECAICHKKENSKTACENGHYICNECHTQGMDSIIGVCLSEKIKESYRDHSEADGSAILSYAWPRASRYGWLGTAHCV